MHSTERREQKGITENQEVDMFDLLLQLWKGKKIILCTLVFALIIAIAYLIFHKPKWISTAVVSMPETGQVADYTNTLLLLYPSGVRKEGAAETFIPSISDIRAATFDRFSALLSARIMQDEYKETVSTDVLKMTQLPSPNSASPIKISYVAGAPEQLDSRLRTLVEQVNQDVGKQLINDLNTNIALRKQELTASLAIQEKLAKEQRAQRIESQASREAGDAVVVIRKDADSQRNYADEYLNTQEQLLKLAALEPEKMKMGTFFYVVEPTAPQEEENKTRIMVVLVSLILGLIAGVGIVLTQSALHNYRLRR